MIRTAIKFGVFVVVCMIFTLYLAFTIGNIDVSDPLNRNTYSISASFDDVTGLIVDDNVKVSGVVVGKVTGVSVEDGRALVEMTIEDDIEIPSDSRASIRWRNLIGLRYVYLLPGKASTMLADGSVITETEDVVDLGLLFNRLGPIVATIDENKVNEFLETITMALEGNEDKLGQALDDIAVLARSLADRDQTIGRLIENLNVVAGTLTDRDQQIRVILDNLVIIAGTFSENTQVVDTALVEFARFSANTNALLSGNAAELDGIINALDAVVTDVVAPRIAQLDESLRNVDVLGEKLFMVGRLGEWLNQTILCASVELPPCPTPIIPGLGLGAVVGQSTPGGAAVLANGTLLPTAPSSAGDANIGNQASTSVAGSGALIRLVLGGAE